MSAHFDTAPARTNTCLADLQVLDHHGNRIPLAALWRTAPALLVSVQRFGSAAALRQGMEMLAAFDTFIERAGVHTALIGTGPAPQAAALRTIIGTAVPVYVDPNLSVHHRLALCDETGRPHGGAVLIEPDRGTVVATISASPQGCVEHSGIARLLGELWIPPRHNTIH